MGHHGKFGNIGQCSVQIHVLELIHLIDNVHCSEISKDIVSFLEIGKLNPKPGVTHSMYRLQEP